MIQTTPAAASQATRSSREPELRAPGDLPIIQVRNLEKTYNTARGPLTFFQYLDLEINPGELVAIVGQSGAGKSTKRRDAVVGAWSFKTRGARDCI